ncbi:LITAF-like zinc ribbon domain-containing protein, partial [Streptococcus pneumoniae]
KKQEKKQEKKQNIITCPNCKSKDVTFLQQDKKAFSVGKAVGGAVLTGGVGALAGFAGKKGNKQWHCQNCGNFFETK